MSPNGRCIFRDCRGVFALSSGDGGLIGSDRTSADNELDEDAGVTKRVQANQFGVPTILPSALTQLWFNDGTGWTLRLNMFNVVSDYGLRGVKNAWLLLHDRGLSLDTASTLPSGPLTSTCTVGLLQHGGLDCAELDPVAD